MLTSVRSCGSAILAVINFRFCCFSALSAGRLQCQQTDSFLLKHVQQVPAGAG
eukprot:m.870725 g.870725  ORF g.870725 m.870725 type:complete len:53 (+) comp59756_c0_seq5:75-233(+)